jgi:aminopeptidase N
MTRRILSASALATAALLMAGSVSGSAVATEARAPLAATVVSSSAYGATGDGIGDPYYPADGNPGYRVSAYHVAFDYFPGNVSIKATTVVHAVAKEDLASYHLDLDGLTVDAIAVNGRAATWTRSGLHELVITPARTVSAGQAFATRVTYHGKLHNVDDGGAPSGWISGGGVKGAGYIEGEPHGCATWFPCNDHPTDKARFSLAATVPRPLSLVSVGHEERPIPGTRHGVPVQTYRWRLSERTSTYMVGLVIDKLTFERSVLADGTKVISAYGPGHQKAMQREHFLPEILRVLSRRWGPYPAPQAGGMFVSGYVPYELETYTRPVYSTHTNLITIVHENGHQWWGDNVALHRWRDICLNECLASYSEWLWSEHNGVDLDRRYRREIHHRGDLLFAGKLYDMGPGHEFDNPVYVKGKFFIHALRNKIGDARFFQAMRGIQRDRAGSNISMIGLRNQLEKRTGVDLHSFWREWVLQTGRPSDANLFPGDL